MGEKTRVVRSAAEGRRVGNCNGSRYSSWQSGREWGTGELERLLNLASSQTIPTIAKQLGRSEKSVRRKLDQLGRTPGMLTGFKSKELADSLQVSIRQIRRWRSKGYLECVSGRITEESFEKFCRNHAEKIPYRQLNRDMQLWLDSFGYPPRQGFRLTELADLLGVSPKSVRRWIALNWLHERQRRISEESVGRLCRQHPDVIPSERLSADAEALLLKLGFRGNQQADGNANEAIAILAAEAS